MVMCCKKTRVFPCKFLIFFFFVIFCAQFAPPARISQFLSQGIFFYRYVHSLSSTFIKSYIATIWWQKTTFFVLPRQRLPYFPILRLTVPSWARFSFSTEHDIMGYTFKSMFSFSNRILISIKCTNCCTWCQINFQLSSFFSSKCTHHLSSPPSKTISITI